MQFGKTKIFGFLVTLLCLVSVLVTACGNQNTTDQSKMAPKSQQHMTFAFEGGKGAGDISTFDPAQTADLSSFQAELLVFTGLVQLDNNMQVQPCLASSWDISADRLTWTFHLKPHLQFSDGTTLDANDVAYSFNRALSPAVQTLSGDLASNYLGVLKDAAAFTTGGAGAPSTLIGDSIIVKDPNTLQLILTKSTSYFLGDLSTAVAWVVEKSVIEKWGNNNWTDHLADHGGQGGDGPFKVLSYDHNTGIKFVPNPYYSGQHPLLQEVTYAFYKTSETGYKAYQANQADQATVPAALVPTEKAKLGSQYNQTPILGMTYLTMNYLFKPFDNIKIRQAFELAINKDVLASSIYNSLVTPTCHIVPSGEPGYNQNLTCPHGAPTSGNTGLAKQLLTEGMKEEHVTTLPPVSFVYFTDSTIQAKLAASLHQMWLTALGVNVQLQSMDFNIWLTKTSQSVCPTPATPAQCLNQGLQFSYGGYTADYPDPQDWTSLQLGTGSSNNLVNYGDNFSTDAATQLATQKGLTTADAMPNGPARYHAYNQLEQQMVNDVAWCSLFQRSNEEANKPWVIGWKDNGILGVPPDYWAHVYIAAH